MSSPIRNLQSPDISQAFCTQCNYNISEVPVTHVRICPHCNLLTFATAKEQCDAAAFSSPPSDPNEQMGRSTRAQQPIQVICLQCDHNVSEVPLTKVKICPHCCSLEFTIDMQRLDKAEFPSPPSEVSQCPDRINGIDMNDVNSDRCLRLCGADCCPYASINSHEVLKHLIETHGTNIWERYIAFTASGIY